MLQTDVFEGNSGQFGPNLAQEPFGGPPGGWLWVGFGLALGLHWFALGSLWFRLDSLWLGFGLAAGLPWVCIGLLWVCFGLNWFKMPLCRAGVKKLLSSSQSNFFSIFVVWGEKVTLARRK